MATKRVSKKNQYISDLTWELDHFKTELERTKDSKEFRPIHYPGNSFTKFAAQKRMREINDELFKIAHEDSYTPWKEETIKVDHLVIPKETVQNIMREVSKKVYPKQNVYKRFAGKTIEDFKKDLQLIVDQLLFCRYQTWDGNHPLENNTAFQALVQLAQEQKLKQPLPDPDDFVTWLLEGQWNFNHTKDVWEDSIGRTALGSELKTMYLNDRGL